jgi:hypothetical protein
MSVAAITTPMSSELEREGASKSGGHGSSSDAYYEDCPGGSIGPELNFEAAIETGFARGTHAGVQVANRWRQILVCADCSPDYLAALTGGTDE